MKRLLSIAVLAIIAIGAMAAPASASGKPTRVGCVTGATADGYWHAVKRVRPSRCGIVDDLRRWPGETKLHRVTGIRWYYWRNKEARGRGYLRGRRVGLTLRYPESLDPHRSCCTAFTQAEINVPGVSLIDHDLPYGFDLWPLY
jgi:hypothetical protein